jgi:hypothetical protein
LRISTFADCRRKPSPATRRRFWLALADEETMLSKVKMVPADEAPSIVQEIRSDWAPEEDFVEIRGKGRRALRAERQRGDGPPWVRDGKGIYYYLPGYRDWLKARMKHPVRGGRPAAQTGQSGV